MNSIQQIVSGHQNQADGQDQFLFNRLIKASAIMLRPVAQITCNDKG
jgi:hypothetical protein